jgi:leukotriene-A4 hydrolase
VGNFEYKPYDERCGIYAEICKAPIAYERFKQLPEFIAKAESLLGPYQWQCYKPILLTVAYPFGAMEHACASFLGGDCIDRIEVLIHELAHAWSGNWVTNASWLEFFFNEGLTSYVEYRICTECISQDYALMNVQTNLDHMRAEAEKCKQGKNTESLKLCGNFQNQDLHISSIPYGKGQLFFMMLESAMGREKFDQFLKDYIEVFALKSMCKEWFLAFLKTWIENSLPTTNYADFMRDNNIEEWLTGTEIPENAPEIQSKLLDKINNAAEKAIHGEVMVDELKSFNAVMTRTFLRMLVGKISKENIEKLEKEGMYSSAENETVRYSQLNGFIVRGAWAQLCASAGYLTDDSKKLIKDFVIARNSVFYANNIVSGLIKTDEGIELAKSILEQGKEELYPATKKVIKDNLAKLNNPK